MYYYFYLFSIIIITIIVCRSLSGQSGEVEEGNKLRDDVLAFERNLVNFCFVSCLCAVV